MRSVVRHGVLVVVFGSALGAFVACGSSDDGPPLGLEDGTNGGSVLDASGVDHASPPSGEDAASSDDASLPHDSGLDAATDAHDGGTDATVDADAGDAGPTTRLFFAGDYAVNNTTSLGRALVPMGAAAPVTATIAPKARGFAVTPDGTKVVFAADVTLAGRWDLYVANADGTNPTLLVTMARAGTLVEDIRLSPNGQTVAFIADIELAGELDAYVVPLAGGAAPVRVTPARATPDAALDVQAIEWSRDSKFLATAGDFTTDGKNELYTVDVTAAKPAPVAVLAAADIPAPTMMTPVTGVVTRLRPLWTAGGKVCVKADLVAAPRTYRLYCAAANGAGFGEPTHLPALPAQIGTYGLSPDGLTLAFSADSAAAPAAYEIYAMPADDSAAATRVTSGNLMAAAGTFRGPDFSTPLLYSPDATKIGFIGDLAIDNKMELYVVPANGASPEKRITVCGAAIDANRDVASIAWSPSSDAMAFIGDHRVDNDFELFRTLDVTTADQTPLLVQGVVVGGDINASMDLDWRP